MKKKQLKNIIQLTRHNSKISLYEYYNTNFNSLSLKSKFKFLTSFYNELSKFNSLKPIKESTKVKTCVLQCFRNV